VRGSRSGQARGGGGGTVVDIGVNGGDLVAKVGERSSEVVASIGLAGRVMTREGGGAYPLGPVWWLEGDQSRTWLAGKALCWVCCRAGRAREGCGAGRRGRSGDHSLTHLLVPVAVRRRLDCVTIADPAVVWNCPAGGSDCAVRSWSAAKGPSNETIYRP
jgi:hypothetical protein